MRSFWINCWIPQSQIYTAQWLMTQEMMMTVLLDCTSLFSALSPPGCKMLD